MNGLQKEPRDIFNRHLFSKVDTYHIKKAWKIWISNWILKPMSQMEIWRRKDNAVSRQISALSENIWFDKFWELTLLCLCGSRKVTLQCYTSIYHGIKFLGTMLEDFRDVLLSLAWRNGLSHLKLIGQGQYITWIEKNFWNLHKRKKVSEKMWFTIVC